MRARTMLSCPTRAPSDAVRLCAGSMGGRWARPLDPEVIGHAESPESSRTRRALATARPHSPRRKGSHRALWGSSAAPRAHGGLRRRLRARPKPGEQARDAEGPRPRCCASCPPMALIVQLGSSALGDSVSSVREVSCLGSLWEPEPCTASHALPAASRQAWWWRHGVGEEA